jgi:hypothetical protein
MSVFTLSPEDVATRAPIFYKATRQWIQKKPEAERAMNEFWKTLELGPDVGLQKLENRIIEGAHQGDITQVDAENKALENEHILTWPEIISQYFDYTLPLINRMSAIGLTRSDSPFKEIQQHGHNAAMMQAYCTEVRDNIYGLLNKTKNLNLDILHEYLLTERVKDKNTTIDDAGNIIAKVGDRSMKLNTQGLTPQSAQELQDTILKPKVGDEWGKLVEIANNLYTLHKKVLEKYGDGVFGEVLNKQLKDNKFYVTFLSLEHIESMGGGNDTASKQIYASVGDLGPIANTVTATVMKDLSLIGSLTKSIMRQKFFEWGLAMNNGSIVEAKHLQQGYFDGPPTNYETVYWLWGGELQAAHVHNDYMPIIAHNPGGFEKFMNTMGPALVYFKYAYVQLRAGFFFVNMFRDAFNTAQNLPEYKFFSPEQATTGLGLLRSFGVIDAVTRTFKELPAMVRHQLGKQTDKTVQDMRWMGIGNSPYAQELSADARGLERIIRKANVFIPDAKYNNIQGKFFGMVEFAVDLVNASDMATKAATVKLLKEKHPDMSEAMIADIVNTRAGTPDTTNKGILTPAYNWLFMYSHVAAKGWEGSIRSAKENPRIFIPKLIGNTVVPRLLAYAALKGMIGWDDESRKRNQRIMQGVPDYFMAGTIVIPLGLTKSGKSVILTIPQDEFSRTMGGWVYYTLKNMDPNSRQSLLTGTMSALFSGMDYAQAQMPGFNPIIKTGKQIYDMWNLPDGEGPTSGFGQPLIPQRVREETKFKGKNWMKANSRSFSYWWPDIVNNTLGLSQFYKFSDRPDEIRDTLEKSTNIPILGDILRRFVRVTSSGVSMERAYEKKAEMEGERAIESNLLSDRFLEFRNQYMQEHKEEPGPDEILALRMKILAEPGGPESLGGIRAGGNEKPKPPMTPLQFYVNYNLKTISHGSDRIERILKMFTSGGIDIETEMLNILSQDLSSEEMDEVIKQGREKRAISWKAIMQYRRKKALEKGKLAKPI